MKESWMELHEHVTPTNKEEKNVLEQIKSSNNKAIRHIKSRNTRDKERQSRVDVTFTAGMELEIYNDIEGYTLDGVDYRGTKVEAYYKEKENNAEEE